VTSRLRKVLLIGSSAVVVFIVSQIAIHRPFESAKLIHLKATLCGPREVMYDLFTYNRHWQTVVARVEAGDPDYLRTAVELYPAIDGESAYDMVGAVAKVIHNNPQGAVEVLLPKYGAGVVCGLDGADFVATVDQASRRFAIIQEYARTAKSTPNLDECLREAQKALDGVTEWHRKHPS